MSDLFEAALRLAARGWPVFPCHPGDKRPAVENGLLAGTTEWSKVIHWWTKHPDCNVGVCTGEKAGFVVLDVDGDEGADSLHALQNEYGSLPLTMSVTTPGGGIHYYFQHPGGGEFRNSASKVGRCLDMRGDGGYVLVPPSRTKDGRCYEVDERAPIAPMPEWLVEISQRHQQSGAPQPPSEWLDIMQNGVVEGGRNHGIARLAGHLLRRYVDLDLTREIVHLVNRTKFKPALPDFEVDQTVDSVNGRELQRREASNA